MPSAGGTQLLQRAISERIAWELLYRGRHFSAAEAQGWGMVNRIMSTAGLMEAALECVRDHGKRPAVCQGRQAGDHA